MSKWVFIVTDKYVRAECPCLSARYTVALLACVGFSIMFGMRCNMSMAKLKMTEGSGVNIYIVIFLFKPVLPCLLTTFIICTEFT